MDAERMDAEIRAMLDDIKKQFFYRLEISITEYERDDRLNETKPLWPAHNIAFNAEDFEVIVDTLKTFFISCCGFDKETVDKRISSEK